GRIQQLGERRCGDLDADLRAIHLSVSRDAIQAALELTDVALDAVSQEIDHLRWDMCGHLLGLGAQNRRARLEIGGLHIDDQAPFEARAKPLLQREYSLWRSLRRDHDRL